jgi:antitoxin Phd
MVDRWELQDAANRFEEVIEKATRCGPQLITDQGIEKVVVISVESYHRLTQSHTDLVDFFRSSPLSGIDLDLVRNNEFSRKVR